MSQASLHEKSMAERRVSAETQAFVDRLRSGEATEEAFAALFRSYYGPVFRFYRSRGFTQEESHDLAQEVFLRVHLNVLQLESSDRFDGWLFSIAANLWRNELRHRSAQSRGADEVSLDDDRGANRTLAEVDSASYDPLRRTLKQERRQLLRYAVLDLPERMRQCMLLRIDQGMSYREIAEILQVSIQTVRKQLFDGRERLKKDLRP